MAVSNNITQHKKQAFLAAYAEVGNITKAAEIAAIARKTHYQWLQDDPEYATAFKDAEEQAGDRLEQEARRRAVEGTEKPVFHQGKQCGAIREFSDTLLIFLLKGARPEKYKERVSSEVSGPQGGPIEIANMTPEERQARIDELIRKRGS